MTTKNIMKMVHLKCILYVLFVNIRTQCITNIIMCRKVRFFSVGWPFIKAVNKQVIYPSRTRGGDILSFIFIILLSQKLLDEKSISYAVEILQTGRCCRKRYMNTLTALYSPLFKSGTVFYDYNYSKHLENY